MGTGGSVGCPALSPPPLPLSLFGSLQEEAVQDAESVRLQQQAHQQHSCTLDECFQLYTKEEQVGGTPKTAPEHHGAGGEAAGAAPGSFRGAHGARCPQLAPDDAWRCPHCRVPQQGTVKLSLWTLPDILIIHLKRFRQVAEHRHKLTTLVRFPLRGLDMAPHLAPGGGRWAPRRLPESRPRDSLYDLYAVCNHHGSMQGGHYTGECGAGRGRQRGVLGGTPGGGQWGLGHAAGAVLWGTAWVWGTQQGDGAWGWGVLEGDVPWGRTWGLEGTAGVCNEAWLAPPGHVGWGLCGTGLGGTAGDLLWGRTLGGGVHNGQGARAGGVGLCPTAAPAGIGLPSLPAPPRSAMGLPAPLHRVRGGPGGPCPPLVPSLTPAPAYCCNSLDGRWYSYDDSTVEAVQEDEVSTRSAYILFYQRRDAIPAWSASSAARGERNRPSPGTSRPPAHCHPPDAARVPLGHARGHSTARCVCHGTVCTGNACTRGRVPTCTPQPLCTPACSWVLHTPPKCSKLQLRSADSSGWSHLAHRCAHPHSSLQLPQCCSPPTSPPPCSQGC